MTGRPVHPGVLSARSGRVRAARRLTRRDIRAQQRLFLAEGPQAVREALGRPGAVREVFALERADRAHPEIREAARGADVPWQPVDESALGVLATTVHPQGVVAVCTFVDRPLESLLGVADRLVVVCADVRDPGNAGTVIRCADAAGADGVVLAGSSVDLYNAKVVRASAGSLFHLPVTSERDAPGVLARLRSGGFQILAADAAGDTDLDVADDDGTLGRATAWVFGNEASGLAEEVAALADHRVAIPIHGRAESLNLATAAAVCLYASARAQRRPARPSPAGDQRLG